MIEVPNLFGILSPYWNWGEGQAATLYNRIRDAANNAAAFPLLIRVGRGVRGLFPHARWEIY